MSRSPPRRETDSPARGGRPHRQRTARRARRRRHGGLQDEVLTAAQGAAIITAALASLVVAALGTTLLAREPRGAGDTTAGAETALAAEPPARAAADG
jgi:hypothetical protein